MEIDIEFQWRRDPALVVVTFARGGIRTDVAGVVAPLFPQSLIRSDLADDLVATACATRSAEGMVIAPVTIHGHTTATLRMRPRSSLVAIRVSHGGARTELLLGLDFLSLFAETRLRFTGEVAHLTLTTR